MMHTIPDGVETVSTPEEAAALDSPPLLVLEPVQAWLDAQGLGAGGLAWERIGDGQSNITYRIQRGGDSFVLRRGPRPPLPRSTHDMVREARIQQILATQDVPVPEILAVCEDESLLGVPFYVMEHVDGLVITDTVPDILSAPEERVATSEALVDYLVRLHSVDPSSGPLASFGKPEGYLARQVQRFAGLWEVNTTRDLPDVALLAEWLGTNLPESQRAAVLHGDFRLGNLMFAPSAPAKVVAGLDWEMAAVGDPLADLGYLTATYAEPGSAISPMELTSVTRAPGYLTRDELVERYRAGTGLDVDALPWYQALALWKASIFCEAIYTRWLRGQRPGDRFAPTLETGVPQLLADARKAAGL